MSPVNSLEKSSRRKDLMINGPKPSPLKINKDSHLIQKPSAVSAAPAPPPKRQGPVIIYTHSPKIIHTQARDFMALVQKLTGFSRSDVDEVNEEPSQPRKRKANSDEKSRHHDDNNDSSSALTDENSGFSIAATGDFNNYNNNNVSCSSDSNPFFADIPLFTPNSTDFFCSPRPAYKFPDIGNLNSPSLLEFMKGLLNY